MDVGSEQHNNDEENKASVGELHKQTRKERRKECCIGQGMR
jgi:hypothetical protein